MAYNFVADSFTQRNFVADFLQAKCDFRRKTAGFCVTICCLHFTLCGRKIYQEPRQHS